MKKFIAILLFSVTATFAADDWKPPTKQETKDMVYLINKLKTIQQAKAKVVSKVRSGKIIRFTIEISKHLSVSFNADIDDKQLTKFKRRLAAILKADPQVTFVRKDKKTWIAHVKKDEVEFEFEVVNDNLRASTKFWDGFAWGGGVVIVAGVVIKFIVLPFFL